MNIDLQGHKVLLIGICWKGKNIVLFVFDGSWGLLVICSDRYHLGIRGPPLLILMMDPHISKLIGTAIIVM